MVVSIFAIVADESVRYLRLLTPDRAAAAIWIAGGILFLVKAAAWFWSRRRNAAAAKPDSSALTDDPSPAAQPIPDTEKSGRKYRQ